jgi:hypothetical protein
MRPRESRSGNRLVIKDIIAARTIEHNGLSLRFNCNPTEAKRRGQTNQQREANDDRDKTIPHSGSRVTGIEHGVRTPARKDNRSAGLVRRK